MQGSDPSFYSTKEWFRTRAKVLKRDGYACQCCGVSVREKGKSRVDHKISRKKRPDLAFDMNNLWTLCIACDNTKHSEKSHWRSEKMGAQKEWAERPIIGPDGWPIEREESDD